MLLPSTTYASTLFRIASWTANAALKSLHSSADADTVMGVSARAHIIGDSMFHRLALFVTVSNSEDSLVSPLEVPSLLVYRSHPSFS